MGNYAKSPLEQRHYKYSDITFLAGECYSMKAEEIHSIQFSRGAKVLFFEGCARTGSVFIEPVVGGHVIETFKVESWMFKGRK